MQPIVPDIYRTGIPGIDRNLDAIATAMRRLSSTVATEIATASNPNRQRIVSTSLTHDGKLLIDAADLYVVAPHGYELGMIQTPTVSAGYTMHITAVFSAATKLHNNATPLAGYSKLVLGHGGTVKDTISLPYAWAAASFLYVASASAWVLTGFNTT